jgi:hypothetical protein
MTEVDNSFKIITAGTKTWQINRDPELLERTGEELSPWLDALSVKAKLAYVGKLLKKTQKVEVGEVSDYQKRVFEKDGSIVLASYSQLVYSLFLYGYPPRYEEPRYIMGPFYIPVYVGTPVSFSERRLQMALRIGVFSLLNEKGDLSPERSKLIFEEVYASCTFDSTSGNFDWFPSDQVVEGGARESIAQINAPDREKKLNHRLGAALFDHPRKAIDVKEGHGFNWCGYDFLT